VAEAAPNVRRVIEETALPEVDRDRRDNPARLDAFPGEVSSAGNTDVKAQKLEVAKVEGRPNRIQTGGEPDGDDSTARCASLRNERGRDGSHAGVLLGAPPGSTPAPRLLPET
jgi:hypothetical protein